MISNICTSLLIETSNYPSHKPSKNVSLLNEYQEYWIRRVRYFRFVFIHNKKTLFFKNFRANAENLIKFRTLVVVAWWKFDSTYLVAVAKFRLWFYYLTEIVRFLIIILFLILIICLLYGYLLSIVDSLCICILSDM